MLDNHSEDPTRISLQSQVGLRRDLDPTMRRMTGIAIHGNTPFDTTFITQIDGNLWQGGCQNGLILPPFFKHVVSLYPWEAYTVQHELSSTLSVRMYDSENQAFDQVEAIAAWAYQCVLDGPTLVHCQAGLNRSSLVAARVLMLSGMNASEAIAHLRKTRSAACLCNPSFERHLLELA